MNWLDILILVIVSFLSFLGWRTGLVRAAVALGGLAAGIYIAGQFFDELGPQLKSFIDNENGARVAAFLILFLMVMAGAVVAGKIVRQVLTLLLLGWVDKMGGLGLGALVGLALCTGLALLVRSFPIGGLDQTVESSLLGSFLVENSPAVLGLLPRDFDLPAQLDLPSESVP